MACVVCTVCGKELNFLDKVGQAFTGDNRCSICKFEAREYLKRLPNQIEEYFQKEMFDKVFVDQITNKLRVLKVKPNEFQKIMSIISYYQSLLDLSEGKVPIIKVNVHLDSDEKAHFSIRATYCKQNKSYKLINGRLIGTNKKMYFVANDGAGSLTINWNNVGKAEISSFYINNKNMPAINLMVMRGSGGGKYIIYNDIRYMKVFIDTLVRLWKRQLVTWKENKVTGSIPEHIKNEVFKRDNGKCVYCGYSGEYIEYDHKIPRSKGGQNTIDNIQLLCRKCNLKKGDRL
jgi:hypothetical protein